MDSGGGGWRSYPLISECDDANGAECVFTAGGRADSEGDIYRLCAKDSNKIQTCQSRVSDVIVACLVSRTRILRHSSVTYFNRSTFSNAFDSGSLSELNTPTIVFIIFINLVLCIGFTVLTFFTVRPPKAWNRWNGVLFKRVSKEEVISYCFCCPAKTQGEFIFINIEHEISMDGL